MRSNLEFWKELQNENYFENHPCYKGFAITDDDDCAVIEAFMPLRNKMRVVVLGCGYGRDVAQIAPRVRCVYGIDVNDYILKKAAKYLRGRDIDNFIPVRADDYKHSVPNRIDLVYSVVVMQHLTRDLVGDYFSGLGPKLSRNGKMIVQFLEDLVPSQTPDAELRKYEPSVSWSIPQIVEMVRSAGLQLQSVSSYPATPTALWHWACVGRVPRSRFYYVLDSHKKRVPSLLSIWRRRWQRHLHIR